MISKFKLFLRYFIRSAVSPFIPSCSVSSSINNSFIFFEGYNNFVGYYDHDPINESNELLFHRVSTAYTNDVEPTVGELYLYSFDTREFKFLISTKALNWQLGSRAQWLSNFQIIFNDLKDGFHCSGIFNIRTNLLEMIFDRPFWAISRDNQIAASLNFSRISKKRPGYGYRGKSIDGDAEVLTLFSTDTGKVLYQISLKSILERLGLKDFLSEDAYLNHVAWSDSPNKFLTIFHIEETDSTPRKIFPVVIDFEKDSLLLVDDSGYFSHHVWLSDDRLLAYLKLNGKKCYAVWQETSGWVEVKHSLPSEDGHPSPLPNSDHVIIDGYPNRFGRMPLYLGSIDGKKMPKKLASITSPISFAGPLRCDLHPRFSSQGKRIICDVPTNKGRQIMILENVLND